MIRAALLGYTFGVLTATLFDDGDPIESRRFRLVPAHTPSARVEDNGEAVTA